MNRGEFIKEVKKISKDLYDKYGILIFIGQKDFDYLRIVKDGEIEFCEGISLEEFLSSIGDFQIKKLFLFNLNFFR